jgi:hypothetical protein
MFQLQKYNISRYKFKNNQKNKIYFYIYFFIKTKVLFKLKKSILHFSIKQI